jgi:hypothetical protein
MEIHYTVLKNEIAAYVLGRLRWCAAHGTNAFSYKIVGTSLYLPTIFAVTVAWASCICISPSNLLQTSDFNLQ